MSGTYRVAIHWRAEDAPGQASAKDARWSLAAVDPIARVMVGTLRASDGAVVPYRLWRSGAEPRGLVVLLHGAFDYSGAYDEIGPILASHGFTALAYDQRGFGGSCSRGKWRGTSRMLCDVTDVVRYMRARFGAALPLFLLGESMGAAIGLQAVAGNSALKVQGLVMAAPGSVAGLFRRFLVGSLLRAAEWCVPQGEVVCERLTDGELIPSSAIRLLMDPMVLRTVRLNMLFGLVKVAFSAVDVAIGVEIPVLTMTGAKDRVLRLACIKTLHSRLAGPKELIVFEGAPHLLLHWHGRDEVLAHVIAWLKQQK